MCECIFDVLQSGGEHLGHWPIMTDKIDDKSLAKLVTDTFIGEQVTHIKEIAGMLTVKGCHDLASVKVGKRNDARFREAELLFDGGFDRHQLGLKYAASQDRGYFDLDLDVLRPDNQFDDGVFSLGFGDLRIGNGNFDPAGNPLHCGVDIGKGRWPRRYRQIGEIDVNREARQVSNK
jgi:hypothetical protein